MAGKIHDEQLNIEININGNKAKKELFGLEKSERSLLRTQKALLAERAKLVAVGEKETVLYDNLTKEIAANNKVLSLNKIEQEKVSKKIGVTGLSVRNLRREQKKLKAIMANLTPNSPQWRTYNGQLQKVEGQLQKVRFEMKGTAGIIDKMNRRMSNFGGVLAALGIYKAIEGVKKLTSANAELSESQTDVKKTTGLTDKEIVKLTKNLKKLDTRTPIIGLLGIAEEAGRLGKKGVKDIQAFVETADKIAVSLGDDLEGEIADNVRVIGKLSDNYGVAAREGVDFATGLEKVGSAINAVSANGSAQAGFMVDYLKRLVGISKQTDITAQAQIGYAAVLDESGQSVEVAGTTMSKVMFDMFSNTSTYAEIAGVDIKDFTKIMNTDANEAFLLFLEGLNGNNGGLQEMAVKLKDLGLKGARSISVLTTLAAETDKVREKQLLANKALKENTSLSEEFQEKNSNLPALLEKIEKYFSNLFTSSWIKDSLKEIVLWFAKLIGVAEDTDGSMGRLKSTVSFLFKIFVIATTALLSYKAAVQLAGLWTGKSTIALRLNTMALKINTAVLTFGRGAALLFKAAFFAMTGQTKKATIAMRAFSVATKLSPIGLLVAVITAAAVAYALFSENAKEAATAQSLLSDAQTKAAKSVAKNKAELDNLLVVAKNKLLTDKERLVAIQEIQKQYPDYLKNLSLENVNTEEGKKLVDDYIVSLNKKAIAMALQEKRVELYKKLVDEENKSLNDNISIQSQLWNTVKSGGNVLLTNIANVKSGITARQGNIDIINKEIEAINNLQKKYGSDISANIQGGNVDPSAPKEGDEKTVGKNIYIFKGGKWVFSRKLSGGGGADNKKSEKQKAEEELTAFLKKQRAQRILDGKEGIEKELADIDAKYAAQMEKATANNLSTKDLEAQRDLEKQDLLLQRRQDFKDKLTEIEENDKLTAEEKEIAKAEADFLKHTDDLLLLQLNKEEESALLKTLELAEKNAIDKIRGKFDAKELKDLENQRRAKLRLNNTILNGALDLAGRESKIGQALLAIKGVLAAKESLIQLGLLKTKVATSAAGATADVAAGQAATAKVGFPQNIPLLIGFAAQAVGIYSAIKNATSAADSIERPGFEDGLYPVTRTDGKKFNAKIGKTKTGLVNEPTLMDGNYLAGERSTARNPEMIIDDITFSKLDPKVINYILDVHKGRSPGYENGKYDTAKTTNQSTATESNTSSEDNERLLSLLERFETLLSNGIEAKTVIGYDKIEEITDLQKEIEDSSNNGIVK